MAPAHRTRASVFFFLLLLPSQLFIASSIASAYPDRPFLPFIPWISRLRRSKIKDSPVREHVQLCISFFLCNFMPRFSFCFLILWTRPVLFLYLFLITHNMLCNLTRDRMRIDANIYNIKRFFFFNLCESKNNL